MRINTFRPVAMTKKCTETRICAAVYNQWWRFGSVGNVVGRINEVNQRRARLVLG